MSLCGTVSMSLVTMVILACLAVTSSSASLLGNGSRTTSMSGTVRISLLLPLQVSHFSSASYQNTTTFQLTAEEQIQSIEKELFTLHSYQQDPGVHTQAQKAHKPDLPVKPHPMHEIPQPHHEPPAPVLPPPPSAMVPVEDPQNATSADVPEAKHKRKPQCLMRLQGCNSEVNTSLRCK